MRSTIAILVHLLLLGQAFGFCPKRFSDSEAGVETTTWQPGAAGAVRVAFSDTLDPPKIAAIKAAFEAWAAVICSTLAFEYLEDSSELFDMAQTSYSAPSSALAEIYVFWIDGTSEPPDFVAGFENTLAHTFPRHDGTGKLTTASIALNAASTRYEWRILTEDNTTFFDIQSVMTRLVAEVIGLDQSNFNSGTILDEQAFYTGLGEREPLQDDQDGMKYLYWDEACSEGERPPDPGEDQFCYPKPTDAGTTDGGATPADAGLDGSAGDAATSSGGCTSTTQCAEGEVCSAEGECVAIGDDDGCSCAISLEPRQGIAGLLLFCALALLLKRRRR
jgi:MYXO-CTERM domain-containing protein